MKSGDPIAPFDAWKAPLEGIHAVEASAGTGKTHNITLLYQRLIIERGLTPERILVVTYTVAATGELRARLRASLQHALEFLRTVDRKGEPTREEAAPRAHCPDGAREPTCDQKALLEHCSDPEQAMRRLGNAIRSFDEAAIFTIHGFCQRVLAENAFDSGVAVEAEVLVDPSELLAECVGDFWRREAYEGKPAWIRHLLDRGFGPAKLQGALRGPVGTPFAEIHGPASREGELESAEQAFAAALEEVRRGWKKDRETICARLAAEDLNQTSYGKKQQGTMVREMDALVAETNPTIPLFKKLSNFTPALLEKSTKKNRTTPTHDFFGLCQTLAECEARLSTAYDDARARMLLRALDFCKEQMARRKAERRLRTFDDLLDGLEKALASPSTGPGLVQTLRSRYGAALIDEFQDTDSQQYSIFRHIFGDHDAPVFLVGDPKQAIYAFRGADVFAYLRARDDARSRATLPVNWRSDRSVVRGVNALFASVDNPFVIDRIPFVEAEAHHDDRASTFREQAGLPPVRAWFLERAEPSRPLPKEATEQRIAAATAQEIARLLASDATLPGPDGRSESVAGHHITVLVRRHKQGRAMKNALAELGIPAVEGARASVFATDEATELERILIAVVAASDDRRVRAALATEILGFDATALATLETDERAWDQQTDAFRALGDIWQAQGFGTMFRQFLREREIPKRLLGRGDGERRLTNLMQIGELLGREETASHCGREQLLSWFASRRRLADEENTPEEHLLRLESDEQLVQIDTLHGSKGLQYPIVFVPFTWYAHEPREKPLSVAYHEPDAGDGRPSLDVGSPRREERERMAEREELAEDVRLLYVALTRAQYHCTFAWGAAKHAEKTALAWLLAGGGVQDPCALDLKGATDDFLRERLGGAANASEGALVATTFADGDDAELAPVYDAPSTHLSARGAPGPIHTRWRITSFSALRSGRGVDLADRDGHARPPTAPFEPRLDIFGFPRGARPGICLHSLFENFDFTDPNPTHLEALVASTLDRFHFPDRWTPVVAQMVRDVLDTDLQDGIRLAEVSREQRLDELEFYYPAGRLTLDALNGLLVEHGYPGVPTGRTGEELPRPLVDGYVKGYIDLTFEAGGRFHLADYKSNWLGPDVDAYRPEELHAVMQRELYTLQYITYTLALHRFLRLRLPDYDYDQHMGSSFYLFVRGMRPTHRAERGVFVDRPPRALIEALDARIGRIDGRRP